MKWGSEYSVFEAELDSEHRTLFQLVNGFDRSHAVLEDIFTHISEHFAHEERKMLAAGYPMYAWHKRQHDGAVKRLKTLSRGVRRGDSKAIQEFSDYLSRWLEDHTRVTDRMMASYLRNHVRTRGAGG